MALAQVLENVVNIVKGQNYSLVKSPLRWLHFQVWLLLGNCWAEPTGNATNGNTAPQLAKQKSGQQPQQACDK